MKKLGIWIIILGFVLGCRGTPYVITKDGGEEEPTPPKPTPRKDVVVPKPDVIPKDVPRKDVAPKDVAPKPDVITEDVAPEDVAPKPDVITEDVTSDGFTPSECDPRILQQECEIFKAINQWRQEVGKCQPFTLNVSLSLVAREHMAWFCNQPQQPQPPITQEWFHKAEKAVPNQLAMRWLGGFGSAPIAIINSWKGSQGIPNYFMTCDYNEIGIGYSGSKEVNHCRFSYNIGVFLVQTGGG